MWAKLAGPRVGGGGKRKGTEGIGVSHQATYLDGYGGCGGRRVKGASGGYPRPGGGWSSQHSAGEAAPSTPGPRWRNLDGGKKESISLICLMKKNPLKTG